MRISGQNNELAQWRAHIAALPLGKTATAAMCHIKQKLRDYNEGNEEPIFVSDRRYQQIAFLVRAAAFCNGHSEPDIIDASVMLHCMWQKGEERETLQGFWHEICTAHAIAAELDSDAIEAQLERYRNAVKQHYAKEKRKSNADSDGFIKLEQPLRKGLKPQYVAVHKDSWAELQQNPRQFADNWWQPRFKLSSGGDWCDSDTYCRIDPKRTNAWQTHITYTYNHNWTGPMVLKNQTTQSAGFGNQKFIETNQNGAATAIMQNHKTLAALETEYQKLETLLAAGMEQVKTERGEKAGVYQANFFCRAEDLRLLTEPAAKVMETLENLRLEAQGIRAEYQSALQHTKRALKDIQSELSELDG